MEILEINLIYGISLERYDKELLFDMDFLRVIF